MSLPVIQLPHDEYTFKSGDKIKYRGLSRAETLQIEALSGDDRPLKIEIACIQFATNVTEEEATQWHKSTPQEEVQGLVDAILSISGLNPEVGKADAEGLHSAKLTELIGLLQKLLAKA